MLKSISRSKDNEAQQEIDNAINKVPQTAPISIDAREDNTQEELKDQSEVKFVQLQQESISG